MGGHEPERGTNQGSGRYSRLIDEEAGVRGGKCHASLMVSQQLATQFP
jgi:hypothetical protein